LVLDAEIVKTRLEKLDKFVRKLRNFQKLSKEQFLADEDVQSLVERNFHLAIECCLDIGNHIIASLGFGTPGQYTDVLKILGKEHVLPREFAEKLEGLAGFRNILVHDYLDIDPGKVYDNLQNLDDLTEFAGHIAKFLEKH
jgi:uncharacterized protein YutE (UPF0331/DUF86 family)